MWVGGFRTAEVDTGAIVYHVKRLFSSEQHCKGNVCKGKVARPDLGGFELNGFDHMGPAAHFIGDELFWVGQSEWIGTRFFKV